MQRIMSEAHSTDQAVTALAEVSRGFEENIVALLQPVSACLLP